jgi:hypothetical protein
MSIYCISKVWAHSRATESELIVLLAIADFADDAGYAYPSTATLAAKARISERTAQRAIRRLEQMGEITVDAQAGQRGCNLYRLFTPAPASTPQAQGVTPVTPRGDTGDGGDKLTGVTPVTPRGDTGDAKGVTPVTPRGDTGDTRTVRNRHRTVMEPPKARLRAKGVQGELGIAPGPAPDPTADIPPNWSLELRQAWSDWSEHRRQSRKPLTAIARRQQIAQLSRWTEAESIANIKRSINAGWSGIFPERTQQPRRGGPVREGEFTKAF